MHVSIASGRRLTPVTPVSDMASISCYLLSLLVVCGSLYPTLALHSNEGDNDLANQLLLPMPYDQSPSSRSRLSDLLAMKNSMSQLAVGKNGDLFMNSEDNPSVDKRVFCNIYTGCGGDFRRRRVRRQRRVPRREKKSATEKRPFCNTYGCYNGRKRSDEPLSYDKTIQDLKVREATRATQGRASDLMKRLLCDTNGGCQSPIKRLSPLPVLVGKASPASPAIHLTPGQTLSLLEILSEQEPRHDKRFFAGGFDNAMENLVNDLRR